MQFPCFRHAVVVAVLPQTQERIDRIVLVNDAVAIPTVLRFIVFRKSKKAVAKDTRWRRWLRCEIAEQFTAVIDRTVGVSIQHTRKLSSDPNAVHAVVSRTPSLSRSKLTPEPASVRSNPLPATSMMIGLSPTAVPPPSYSHWQSGQECCHQPIFCGHVLVQNPLPPVLSGVGDGARDGTGGGYELFSVF